jgi:hypothetical protein
LWNPNEIFDNINLDLYVADCYNDRIQLFHPGQSNGITVAGSQSLTPTIALLRPTGGILNGNNYLYIADGSSPTGFHCLFGCSGSSPDRLRNPHLLLILIVLEIYLLLIGAIIEFKNIFY